MWLEPARLTRDAQGIPYSSTYGDVYHAAAGGPAQSRHVFLGGNDLPARWQGRERFVILETGFGLGLNFLTTWAAWQEDPQRCRRLHFVSVEKHPFTADDLARAHEAWPQSAALSGELRRLWPPLVPGIHRLHLAEGQIILTLVFGDAVTQLRKLDMEADAFYLDGFSPACNPELWTPEICHALARLAAPGATLATWSVAGHLREALAAVEFDLEKRPGFAGKRHMLVGRYRSRKPSRHALPDDRRAIILGAGIAGSTTAHRLAARGWQVTVLERGTAPGQGASGNLSGVLRPLPSVDDNRLARLTRAGFLATRDLLRQLGESVRWQSCGVLHLARDDEHAATQRKAAETLTPPAEFFQFVDADAASALAGWPIEQGGWWFPGGGWVQPPSLCTAALAAYPQHVTLRCNTVVADVTRTGEHWQALAADGAVLAEAPVLVIAAGADATDLPTLAWLPQRKARGQVSHLPAAALPPLDKVICKLGYVNPAVDGFVLAGASFLPGDPENGERLVEHQDNLAKLNLILPGFARDITADALGGRVGFRPASPDRLPIVGAVPDGNAHGQAGNRHQIPLLPGLWCAQGYGARGIVWSALMAELLASRIDGDPLPLENDLVDACAPRRFLEKNAKTKFSSPMDDPAS